MVRIGTRFIISFNGKQMLATHWGGYPSSLGLDLLHYDKSINAMIEVAKGHTIDTADPWLIDVLNRERIRHLAGKHQLTAQDIKAGKRRENVTCVDDYEIIDIRNYGDWAEYQYDIRGKQIHFRSLTGWWPESLKRAAELRLLSEKTSLIAAQNN